MGVYVHVLALIKAQGGPRSNPIPYSSFVVPLLNLHTYIPFILDPFWFTNQSRRRHHIAHADTRIHDSNNQQMSVNNQPGPHCGEARPIDRLGFRVSALFVILLTSLIGTLFPIITKRVKYLRKRVPGIVFEFGK